MKRNLPIIFLVGIAVLLVLLSYRPHTVLSTNTYFGGLKLSRMTAQNASDKIEEILQKPIYLNASYSSRAVQLQEIGIRYDKTKLTNAEILKCMMKVGDSSFLCLDFRPNKSKNDVLTVKKDTLQSYLKELEAEFDFVAKNTQISFDDYSFTTPGQNARIKIDYEDFKNELISNISDTTKFTNHLINDEGGGLYSITFNQKTSRKFFITTLDNIKAVSSLALINSSNLQNTINQADAIYIGTKELIDGAAALVTHRTNEGYAIMTVDIEDIYNEFGKGSKDPVVVKEFLQYAYENWTRPAPKYVLLLGDSTYDPKGILSTVPQNTIPVKYLKGSSIDYPSDNWFIAFGENDLPYMAIGRIPGNTSKQIADVATKIIEYETGASSPDENQKKQIYIIVDEDQGTEKFNDKALSLKNKILAVHSSITITLVKRSDLSDAQINTQILDSFNNGTAIIHYIGHGADNMWADLNVLEVGDIQTLNNTITPLVVSMNCQNAFFTYEEESERGLGEELLFKARGGAIAFWGSTNLTTPNAQKPFQDAFYEELVSPDNQRLGDAINSAKYSGGPNGEHQEVINSWTLLGDPMLKVAVSRAQAPSTSSAPISLGSSKGGGCTIYMGNHPFNLLSALLELLALILIPIFFRRFHKIFF